MSVEKWWTERPDPSRGREVLDGIDRFRLRIAAMHRGSIHSVPDPAPIAFDGDSDPHGTCIVCLNDIGGTKNPRPSKDGWMHPSCDSRWKKMSVNERAEIRLRRKLWTGGNVR